jgi:hypothetical protein
MDIVNNKCYTDKQDMQPNYHTICRLMIANFTKMRCYILLLSVLGGLTIWANPPQKSEILQQAENLTIGL